MKVLSWLIALCGLWEFGDIAALFVPNFGPIPAYLWNHILTGLLLMIAGAWSALSRSPTTTKRLHIIAAAAGAWLVIASFLLSRPSINAGLWNDIIVGGVALILGAWLATKASRVNSS